MDSSLHWVVEVLCMRQGMIAGDVAEAAGIPDFEILDLVLGRKHNAVKVEHAAVAIRAAGTAVEVALVPCNPEVVGNA